MRRRLGAILVAFLWPALASAIPVIPGAPTSYGMDTRAAYGCGTNPTVIKVTNLNDAGPGSFRQAVTTAGPRVVIFEKSGYISITSTLVIDQPCLTVAGQTAPSPGITIRSSGSIPTDTSIYINTHDVLMQHLAIRPGASTCNAGLQVYGGDQQNIVFDHMSFSWGQDENLGFNWTNGQDTQATVWRSVFAEGLFRAPGSDVCLGGGVSNGHGILIDTDARHVAVIQSVFATNYERNPYMLGRTNTALINNLQYQVHGPWGFFFNNGSVCGPGCGTNDPWYSSVVGNRYIIGPNTCCTGGGDDATAYMIRLSVNGTDSPNIAGNKLYKSDNTVANQNGTVVEYSNSYSYDPAAGISTYPTEAPLPTGLTVMSSALVEAFVKTNSGSRPADRDAVDTRIFAYITARTAGNGYISTEATVGGYPTLAVNTRTLTVPANPHTTQTSGYTALEEWLHSYAGDVEGFTVPPPDPTDPGAATGTVVVSATFTGTTGLALTNYVSGTGGGWALQTGSTGVLQLSNAGRLESHATNEGALTLAAGLPISTQYDIDVDARVFSLIPGSSYGIWGRALPFVNTGYFFNLDVDTMMLSIVKVLNGSYETLKACSVVLTPSATPIHFTFRMRDASQHAIVGGTQCASTSNHDLVAAGQAGISAYGATVDTDTTGIHFDNFLVTDVQTLYQGLVFRYRFRR